VQAFIFDIGWGELVLIGVVALIVIGPKELPATLRTLGQYMTKIRRMAAEFQSQFQEAMREAEMADLKQHFDSIQDAAKDLRSFDPVATVRNEIETAAADKPAKSEGEKPATASADKGAASEVVSSAAPSPQPVPAEPPAPTVSPPAGAAPAAPAATAPAEPAPAVSAGSPEGREGKPG
jgi:sec-independent protein translocase protein TatB